MFRALVIQRTDRLPFNKARRATRHGEVRDRSALCNAKRAAKPKRVRELQEGRASSK